MWSSVRIDSRKDRRLFWHGQFILTHSAAKWIPWYIQLFTCLSMGFHGWTRPVTDYISYFCQILPVFHVYYLRVVEQQMQNLQTVPTHSTNSAQNTENISWTNWIRVISVNSFINKQRVQHAPGSQSTRQSCRICVMPTQLQIPSVLHHRLSHS